MIVFQQGQNITLLFRINFIFSSQESGGIKSGFQVTIDLSDSVVILIFIVVLLNVDVVDESNVFGERLFLVR